MSLNMKAKKGLFAKHKTEDTYLQNTKLQMCRNESK